MNRKQKIAELKARIEKSGNVEDCLALAEEYHANGETGIALHYYKIIEEMVQLNPKKRKQYLHLPNIYYGIGMALIDMERYNEAFFYFAKGLKMAKDENRREQMDLLLFGIAEALGDLGHLDMLMPVEYPIKEPTSSEDYLPYFYKLPYKRFRGDSYGAIDYFEKALHISRLYNDVLGLFVCKVKLGSLYAKIGNYYKAKKFLVEAVEDARNIEVDITQKDMPSCFTIKLNGRLIFDSCVKIKEL
jgi:tetratricopeptide (TPR) repeat protein